jgi:hypothetical protein
MLAIVKARETQAKKKMKLPNYWEAGRNKPVDNTNIGCQILYFLNLKKQAIKYH